MEVIGLICAGLALLVVGVLVVAFHRSRSRESGYAESDVDAFLSYVERRMAVLGG